MAAQNLDKFFKELAKKEVGENSGHVSAHLASFKRWITACPHLQIPNNDTLLLGFLRYAHYEHSMAQKRIDNFCTLRCSDKTTSVWYQYPPLNDPCIENYLNSGVFLPMGFMPSGTFVVLMRLTDWSTSELDYLSVRRVNNMNYDRLILDERCQIGGFCLFIDLNNMSIDQARQWGDLKDSKAAFRLMQEAVPGRTKNIVFYKESKIFDTVYRVAEVWLNDKMKKRIHRVGSDIDKAFKKIKGLEDVLPVEYGGKNGTVAEAKQRNRTEFLEYYSKGYPLEQITVDESKRPNTAKKYLSEYKEVSSNVFGTAGTYIKLDPCD